MQIFSAIRIILFSIRKKKENQLIRKQSKHEKYFDLSFLLDSDIFLWKKLESELTFDETNEHQSLFFRSKPKKHYFQIDLNRFNLTRLVLVMSIKKRSLSQTRLLPCKFDLLLIGHVWDKRSAKYGIDARDHYYLMANVIWM